jgi:hypothetical protein
LQTEAAQIDWKLTVFCSATHEDFGIYQQNQLKLTVFCSAALPTEHQIFTQIDWKLTGFCSVAQGKFWNCQQKQLKSPVLTVFCSAAQRIF